MVAFPILREQKYNGISCLLTIRRGYIFQKGHEEEYNQNYKQSTAPSQFLLCAPSTLLLFYTAVVNNLSLILLRPPDP